MGPSSPPTPIFVTPATSSPHAFGLAISDKRTAQRSELRSDGRIAFFIGMI